MDISSSSNGLNATFETSVVTIVRCIFDAQIINTMIWLEIYSVKMQKRKRDKNISVRLEWYDITA